MTTARADRFGCLACCLAIFCVGTVCLASRRASLADVDAHETAAERHLMTSAGFNLSSNATVAPVLVPTSSPLQCTTQPVLVSPSLFLRLIEISLELIQFGLNSCTSTRRSKVRSCTPMSEDMWA